MMFISFLMVDNNSNVGVQMARTKRRVISNLKTDPESFLDKIICFFNYFYLFIFSLKIKNFIY